MTNPQETMDQLQKLGRELAQLNAKLVACGTEKAEAERQYRMALAKEIMILRANKTPVTIISDLARGNELVSELKLNRDALETLYDSIRYNIRGVQERIDIGRSVLTWLRAEYTNGIN